MNRRPAERQFERRRHGIGRRLLGVGIVAALLVGCGGGEDQPTIPADLGEELSQRADQIAATLESGDECAAKRQARDLRAEVRRGGDAGRIELELGDPLLASVDALAGQIECDEDEPDGEPRPEPEPADEPRGEPLDCEALEQQRERVKEQGKAEEERVKEQRKAAEERAGDDKEAREAVRERFKEEREQASERSKAREEALAERIAACEDRREEE